MGLRLSDCTSLLSNEKLRKAAVIIGAALIVLIFLSTLGGDSEKPTAAQEDTAAYEQQLEQRLETLLSQIDGVGEAQVLLTLDSTTEHVYARDTRQSEDSSGSDTEATIVLATSGSEKTAIEQSSLLPKVRGVAVVCDGAQRPEIKERVVNAVAAALGIGTSKIYVTY